MSLTLANISYPPPPSFFTPPTKDVDIKERQWEIRSKAEKCIKNKQYGDAAKLYLKLYDNSVSTDSDLTNLILTIYTLITDSIKYNNELLINKRTGSNRIQSNPFFKNYQFCKNGLNFSEIHTINFFWKNIRCDINYDKQQDIISTCNHLDSITKKLTKAFESTINNTLLLLESVNDKGCSLSSLNHDLIQTITVQSLEIIKDICLTPVDISREGPFCTSYKAIVKYRSPNGDARAIAHKKG